MSVEFNSNRAEIQRKFNDNKRKTLTMIGEKQKEIAALEITDLGAVDTGLMRTSNGYRVGENEVIVGNTVSYAIYVNGGTRRMPARPFLENSVLNHMDTYRQIVIDNMGAIP